MSCYRIKTVKFHIKKWLTGILFYLCASYLVCGQSLPFIRFSEADGLAGNSVQDILRDNDGFIWIATESGLSKYDGTVFRNFEKSDGLPNNKIWSLSKDDRNLIYVACHNGGLAKIKNDRIINVLHTKDKFPDSFRKLYFSNSKKALFVGTDFGIYVLKDSVLIRVTAFSDSLKKNSVLAITESQNRIFFSVHGSAEQGLYELKYNSDNPQLSESTFLSFHGRFSLTTRNDTLFSSDYFRIYANPLYDIEKQIVYAELDTRFLIWNLKPYQENDFLLGGFNDGRFNGNMAILDAKRRIVKENPFKIDAHSTFISFQDSSSGVLYLGTDNGLFCFPETPVRYTEFRNIKHLMYYHDSLYVLTDDAVYYYRNNSFKLLKLKRQVKLLIDNLYPRYRQWHFDTHASFELNSFNVDNNTLYLQTSEGALSFPGLTKYMPFGTGTFISSAPNSGYVQSGYYELRYIKSFDKPDKYLIVQDKKGTPLSNISEMIECDSVVYMISNVKGLAAIKNMHAYVLDESNSVIENSLSDIDKSPEGKVWVSSSEGNLYEVVLRDSIRIIRILNQANGNFRGTKIKWIKFTPGYLFVATDKGLNLISLASLDSTNPVPCFFLNENNGYPFKNAVSPTVTKEGKLYVHDSGALIEIDTFIPENREGSFYYPSVKINDTLVKMSQLNSQRLPPSTWQVQIVFARKKFPVSGNLSFRYKVNENPWIQGNQVTLQSLKPGKYRILAEIEDREFSKKTTEEISFSIDEPVTHRWWFIILVVFLSLLIMAILFMLRIRRIKKEQAERTEIIINNSEIKLRSLQIQMNPHFIFNALNSIQYFIVTNNIDESLEYLNNLARIIRINLENANEEYIPLSNEKEFLEKYISIEKLRFSDKISIELSDRTGETDLLLPPMLIQPVIENALKYGIKEPSGTIKIDFCLDGCILKITVTDNGQGRKKSECINAEKGKSLGISTIRKRLELLNVRHHTTCHNLDIIDLFSDGKPAGTKVEISLLSIRKKKLEDWDLIKLQ